MAQVELKNVNKSFGQTKVIKDVHLSIEKGEFVVFVGPSGCGKSTLLRLIAGLEYLSNGEIIIADRPVMDLPPSERGIAMVFQSYALYPHMSVFQNMAFSLSLQKFSKAEIRTRVEFAKLHKQLDATTIYVTHDQVEAMTLADKIVVLRDGEVMRLGSPMDLFNSPDNEFVAGFLGSPQMNFFDGSLAKVTKNGSSGSFKGHGFEASDIRLTTQRKKTNDPVRLGVRPQHLKIKDKGNLAGQVTLVEKLGTETVVELINENGTLFRYAAAETPVIAIGDKLKFEFENSRAHLF